MANNPYVNKVNYGNDTIIDLTGDTVTPANVASGKTFHDASGTARVGALVPSFPYKKSGTIPDFTAVNQEQTIDTGLDEIKYVYVEGYPATYTSSMVSFAVLDKDRSFAKQVVTNCNAGGTNVAAVSSGSASDGIITTAGIQIKVSGISGGQLTIKTGNNANYLHKNVKWYAG